MKRIFLIDCPGVVYPESEDTETDIVLKGVVRVENLENAEEHIPAILQRVKKDYLVRAYNISKWDDHEDFLAQYARKTGKLLKKGEPDINTAAKMILYDWQRGKIPYFVPPPFEDNEENLITSNEQIEVSESSLQVKQKFKNIILSTQFDDADTYGKEGDKIIPNEDEVEVDWDILHESVKQGEDKIQEEIEEEKEEKTETELVPSKKKENKKVKFAKYQEEKEENDYLQDEEVLSKKSKQQTSNKKSKIFVFPKINPNILLKHKRKKRRKRRRRRIL